MFRITSCSLISILLALLTMNFYCIQKDTVNTPVENTFQVPVSISPLKKTYSLADTIWLTIDTPGKFLFDTKSNKNVLVDTGELVFGAAFNEFGTYIMSPPNGFCDVITSGGINVNRDVYQWGTSSIYESFGCNQTSFRYTVGFKPNEKGTYYLSLPEDLQLNSCSNKIITYNSTVSYKYQTADLGLEIFNGLSENDKGRSEGVRYYTDEINNEKIFVFKVE